MMHRSRTLLPLMTRTRMATRMEVIASRLDRVPLLAREERTRMRSRARTCLLGVQTRYAAVILFRAAPDPSERSSVDPMRARGSVFRGKDITDIRTNGMQGSGDQKCVELLIAWHCNRTRVSR